ncbi:MAG: hypothetical protein Q9201_005707 [Fulgogasparrea decipioides]
MLARSSRRKLSQNVNKTLHISPNDLYLPWLCPALYREKSYKRQSSIIASSQVASNARPVLPRSKNSSPTQRSNARSLASATAFDYGSPADDYVPFENGVGAQPREALQFPWMPTQDATNADHFDADPPLIIKDSLTTRPPRFRSFNAITGDLGDIVSTMKACLHVGRFERAAALMRRLNSIYKPDAPALLAVHNDYIRGLSWKIISTKDQQLLKDLQTWFEVELRGRGIVPDATTYAFMIQAAMQGVNMTKSNRSIRRYLQLAEENGLRMDLMNFLVTILNEQDLGRVTRVCPPELDLSNLEPSTPPEIAPSTAASNVAEPGQPEVRPVNGNLPGWKALKASLSVFTDPSVTLTSSSYDEPDKEKAKRLAVERQLRMEQDTYESAIQRWRTDSEQLKKLGINSVLKHNSFGAMMWNWHEALEPAIREEIKLANEAESKAVKKAVDEDRCHYGPFLQYLKPEKLSAITILSSMMMLGTSRTGERGSPIVHVVMNIGEAIQDESVAEYLKTMRFRQGTLRSLPHASGVRDLTEELKKRRKGITTRLELSPNLSAQALEGQQWSKTVKARIGAVLLSKLIDNAKLHVCRKHPETGKMFDESQPAFLHQFFYSGGRRTGMLSLNSSMYDQLAKEPVAASLAQKYLPMLVEPKPWTGFQNGGYLTSTEPMVRLSQSDEQSKQYAKIAIDNGDMMQVTVGLDVLSKTPWQINGPVFEVMLEAWNSGEAIGDIAPENPDIKMPPEPVVEDKAAHAKYLSEIARISNQKAGYKSMRCYQNFQMEIARAYLKETFYFPHNVDFRGRAYPMSPILNYMGADLCRGMLVFGIGKELGPNGLRWLKIHLANLYGYDKASFEDRVTFVENNLSEIFDSATAPLHGRRWWLQAEDPWQCLAACKELHNAMISPEPHRFVSKLAIHQDGTCNGLQHYAALGGDSLGARQVNLEPGDKPSDIYTGVAELVKEDIAGDAKQGHEIAKALEGKITRKVVKQTVMTNVYGVTFMGARLQVTKQLKELYPDFPRTETIHYRSAGFYIAKKVFKALANLFNGAHDIQYWLGDCAGRIATAVTPEQMQRIEAAKTGTLNEPNEFQRTPLKRKAERGTREELLSFKQSVIWTSPLKMPVVQPYRQKTSESVSTNLQRISLNNPSLADPVNKRKQLQAFPPNFIHSLDATHMLLSALACKEKGLTFTAVHDSFWTHASDVETMNRTLRDTFIKMHSENIIGRLGSEFAIRYKDCMYMTAVKASSRVGKKIKEWRGSLGSSRHRGKVLENIKVNELLQEWRRLRLLASEKPEERRKGEAMVTACSIFQQSAGEDDLAAEEDLTDVALGNTSPKRENKLQADETLAIGDEGNIGSIDTIDETGVPDRHLMEEEAVAADSVEIEAPLAGDRGKSKRPRAKKGSGSMRKIWLWRPLTFPPVPKKVYVTKYDRGTKRVA